MKISIQNQQLKYGPSDIMFFFFLPKKKKDIMVFICSPVCTKMDPILLQKPPKKANKYCLHHLYQSERFYITCGNVTFEQSYVMLLIWVMFDGSCAGKKYFLSGRWCEKTFGPLCYLEAKVKSHIKNPELDHLRESLCVREQTQKRETQKRESVCVCGGGLLSVNRLL